MMSYLGFMPVILIQSGIADTQTKMSVYKKGYNAIKIQNSDRKKNTLFSQIISSF